MKRKRRGPYKRGRARLTRGDPFTPEHVRGFYMANGCTEGDAKAAADKAEQLADELVAETP